MHAEQALGDHHPVTWLPALGPRFEYTNTLTWGSTSNQKQKPAIKTEEVGYFGYGVVAHRRRAEPLLQ